jgi:signal transduction histidine kinase
MEDIIKKSIETEKNNNISIMIRNTIIAIIGIIVFFIIGSYIFSQPRSIYLLSFISTIILIVIYIIFHILIKNNTKLKNSIELILIAFSIIPIYFYNSGVKSPLFLIYLIILFEYTVVNDDVVGVILINILITIINISYIFIIKDYSSQTIMLTVGEFIMSILITYESKSIINFTKNVTNQYEIEREDREKIEKINKDKDEFISTTSHELRTPISAVRGYLQLITFFPEYQDLKIEIREKIEDLTNTTEDLTKLIENLLAASRLDLNRIFINKVDININSELLKTIDRIIKKSNDKNISIIFRPEIFDVIINTDPDKFSDSIFNILDNSVKFSENGKKIYIYVKKKNNKVIIKMKDQGIGISKDIKDHLFEKFQYNEDGSKKTVLGLYLSKRLLNTLGGDIEIKSQENIGTITIIEI